MGLGTEVVTVLLDKYGPQAVILLGAGYLVYKAVMVGLRFFDRVSDTNARHTQTQDTIDEGQTKIALTLAQQNKDGQERLFNIQDTMLKQQQSSQETTNRFSDEISKATLTLAKAVTQLEGLAAHQANWSVQVMDWDTRMGLFMEHQKTQDTVQSQMLIHIRTILTMMEMVIVTLNTLISTLTPQPQTKEKDASS